MSRMSRSGLSSSLNAAIVGICLPILFAAMAAYTSPSRPVRADEDVQVKSAGGPLDLAGLLKTFRDEFVPITPGEGDFTGTFTMGDAAGPNAAPSHEVAITYKFEVARYEVPQNLWEVVMGENPSRWKGPRNSVELLSLADARRFCRQVTQAMRDEKLIGEDQEVRLPSEAEWEYCARAGTATRYSFGSDDSNLGDFAWYTGNAAGNDPPVGAKKPNAWGLFDMHGYLWEWCEDAWRENYQGAPADGSAWGDGADTGEGVLRGGSWKDKPPELESAARRRAKADLKDDAVGLRCVLSACDTR